MAALITYSEQQTIRPISDNLADKFDMWALEVQERDLKKLLGQKMYLDLVANPTESKYVELLDGGAFTIDDFEYTQKGLKYVLAYFIQAEYITDSRFNDTFAGFTQKNVTESTRSQYGELKAKKMNARELAFSYFQEIKLFLDDNKTTYEYWSCATKKKLFNPKITKI